MKDILEKYLPHAAVDGIFSLIQKHRVHLKIVNERKTRHGDYRKINNKYHVITVNANLNKYKFLLTTVHEIAHLVAFETYGRMIKPHGLEWKHTFRLLILPFINPNIFPNELLPLLARHFKNPPASSDIDAVLSMALKKYDTPTTKIFIDELPLGTHFHIGDGRVFQKGKLRVKLFECKELESKKIYLFRPNSQVEVI